jgi:L-lactate dehydrogenase
MSLNKLGIIGMGWVGSSVAISILQRGLCKELLLNDINADKAEAEAMDLNHGSSFYPSCKVQAASISEMKSCRAIVITAGRGGTANETRLQLLEDNVKIAKAIANELAGYKGIIIVVANPVDVLTYYYQKFSGLSPNQVIGTGTMLDTARLREITGRKLDVDPRSIHAQVVGEHGDSEVVLWSTATIGGMPLREWEGWNTEIEEKLAYQVKHAAYEIIQRKGATNHAIGLVTATLLKWILRGERRVITLSSSLQGLYGFDEVAISLPSLICDHGISEVLNVRMNETEKKSFERSADVIQSAIRELPF